MGDKIAYQNTRFSLTARASDEDEGQKVSYSLGEGAPDGARISSSGSLSWMPDESTDMGMPWVSRLHLHPCDKLTLLVQ